MGRFAACSLLALVLSCTFVAGAPQQAFEPVDDLAVCDAAVRDAPSAFLSYDCFRAYVNHTGDRDGALARLEALATVRPEEPWLFYNLALLTRRDYRTKIDRFDTAHTLFTNEDDDAAASRTLAEMSYTALRYGKVDQAKQWLEEAEARALGSGDSLALMFVKIRRAKLASRVNEFDRAWALCQEAIADPRFDDLWVEHRLSAFYMASLAGVRLGLVEAAYDLADRALTLAQQEGENKHVADAADAVMWAVAEGANFGLFSSEEALDIARTMRPFIELGGNKISMYQYFRMVAIMGQGAERLETIEFIESVARKQNHPHMLSSVLAHKALITGQEHPEQVDRALDTIREAVSLRADIKDDFIAISYYRMIAELSMRKADRRAAIDTALTAIEAVESRRVRLASPEASSRMAGTQAEIHYLLADYLLGDRPVGDDDLALAFRVLEQLRARRLILETGDTSELPADMRERADELRREISRAQLELMLAEDPGQRSDLQKELDRLESREILLLGDLDRRPRVVPLSEFARPADVQSLLAPDAVLVYLIASDGLPAKAIVVHRDNIRIADLPDTKKFMSGIGMWTGSMRSRDALEEVLSGKIGELLAPVFEQDVLDKKTIYISADGPFHRLPFEAVHVGDERLGHRRNILYVPSATYFLRQADAQPLKDADRSLVMADPLYDWAEHRATARDATLSAAALGSLPFARIEAAMVSRALGPNTNVRVGDTASESFLKTSELGEYRLIHFAAHALVNERVPSRSAVVLTPGLGEDGLLQQRDIQQLDLTGAIIVLAACQSAAGETIRGDGVVSLANSFLRAGARAVIASRWMLDDAEASRFFTDFYGSMARGVSVSEALRAARTASAARGDHPAAWAGVLAIGQPAASIPATEGSSASWRSPILGGVFGAVGALVGVLLMGWLRRRRQGARAKSPA